MKHEGPCALDIFQRAGYSPQEAHEMAIELTCLPMDCDVASEQALEAVRRLRAGATVDELIAEADASMRASDTGAGQQEGP